jgi:hemerythrin-like domain-containing protein
MLETDHQAFMVELRELESILKASRANTRFPVRILNRLERFVKKFESHMGSHFKAEEKAVFPHLRRHAPRLSGTLLYLIAEHRVIQKTLAAWKKSFKKSKARADMPKARASVFQGGLEWVRLLRNHVERETRLMRRVPTT